jgi:hypothetical protein
MTKNIPNGHNILKMGIKYTNIFHSESLQKLPNCDFWLEIYTIWQPCPETKWAASKALNSVS